MPSDLEYALLAANAYAASSSVVSVENTIPLPNASDSPGTVWTLIAERNLAGTGFLARAYRSTNGEIVISYGGTTFEGGTLDKLRDWLQGNVPAGTGAILAPQVTDAARFYLDIVNANPEVPLSSISLTGHSLGGGLASLMAVFFDEKAVTFDSAPFEKSADSLFVVTQLKFALLGENYLLPSTFANYIALDPVAGTFLPSPSRVLRESNVSHVYLSGEALQYLRGFSTQKLALLGLVGLTGNVPLLLASLNVANIAGHEMPFDPKAQSGNGWGVPTFNGNPIDLHYMPLLISFMQSRKLLNASVENPELLQKIFTSRLNFPQESANRNFINLMVQQQLAGNGAWDAFAEDIQKLSGALNAGAIKAALVDLEIGMDYAQGIDRALGVTSGAFESVFNSLSGGIQFEPPPEHAQWFKDSLLRLRQQLSKQFVDVAMYVGGQFDRYALQTEGALTAPAKDDDKSDLLVGGADSDILGGGGGRDTLIGYAGDDTLEGGSGDDILIGGAGDDTLDGGSGFDTYVVEGSDTIQDSDGRGILKDKAGNFISGAIQKRDDGSYVYLSDPSVGVTRDADLTLTFTDGTVVRIKNYQDGDLGMQLVDASAQGPVELTISGDILPTDLDPGTEGIQAAGDAQGNPIGTSQPYEDILGGSAGNDHISSGALNDDVGAGAGDDWIESGDGSDYVGGGAGNDLIEGGTGSDILIGEEGNDRIYANAQIETSAAIANGNSDTGTGLKGDWLTGNAGNDTLVAGADDDVLAGGAGSDLLIAGAGDDNILGDADYVVQFIWEDAPRYSIGGTNWYHSSITTFDWTITPGPDSTVFAPVVGETNPAGGAADTIYAGNGNDHVWAGDGDDTAYGEGGNDTLVGEAGNDVLIGGAGDDTLFGDASYIDVSLHGNDYLDGGDGNDTLWGGGGDDSLFGGSGDDKLYGETGANYLDGEDGNDILNSGGPGSELFGGAGDDEISAAGGGNYLDGGEGNNTLNADGGDNTLFAGAGDDALSAAGGNNYLDGGDGTNTLLSDGGGNTLIGGAGNDTLSSGGGNSYLDGGDGDNTLIADGGGNTLFGGSGDDTLSSTGGNSYLDAGDGNNTLIADGGGNTLFSGSGDDTLSSAGGDSYLDGGDGNDTLVVDGGGNTLIGGAGDDLLQAADGNDSLAGDDGNDELQGGDGDDRLDGGSGNDILFGQLGNDTLLGGAGDDYLEGGVGADYLAGGEGYDRYYYAPGDGIDTIVDSGSNAVSLAYFYSPFLFKLRLGSLVLDFGNGDAIHIAGFDPDDPLGTSSITEFSFDGGTVLTLQDVLAQGFDLDGTEDADVLEGTVLDDRMNAFGGDDLVIAKAGNDTVDAGDGADIVFGGAGNDDLAGGAGDDQLSGDEGDDRLYGGAGADLLTGGTGDDTYVVDDTLDTIVENAGEGYDVIEASISYTIADNVEELDLTGSEDLTGTGDAGDNTIAGNDGDNLLVGLEGDDTLYGGAGDDVLDGGAGGDLMLGGAGDDLYLVDSEDDAVAEEQDYYNRDVILDPDGNVIQYGALESSGGYDTVESSVSFALDPWTEALVLTGGDAIDGTGNVESNNIEGNDAANALYAYRLNGQADLYPTGIPFIQQFTVARDAAEEMLADKANAAIFRAETQWFTPLNVDLVAGDGDTLVGNGGDDRLYGGLDDDVLLGGDGNDLLYGFAGADYMAGGAGDDTYVVSGAYDLYYSYLGGEHVSYYDASSDDLYEAPDEGTDTVVSEVDFVLPDNFENLTLVFDTRDYDPDGAVSTLRVGRTIATVGEGNTLDNVIIANDAGNELYGDEGNDTLIGGAGSDYLEGDQGADTMIGGAGDDEYDVDDPGDVVIEDVGGGHDDVYSAIDYTLGANVEDLYLGGDTYSEDLSGTGNELDNLIVGNDGDNVLMGLAGNDVLDGGFGDDVMEGGTGDDSYYVDSEFDVTTENAGEGHDTVYAEVSHVLGDNIEDLTLTGFDDTSGTGNELDNLILGNDGDNLLEGLDGNDTLDGGAGDDLMVGGTGDDSYYVDSYYDEVDEADGEGIDTVYENLNYYDIPDAVENVTIPGDFSDPDVFDNIYETWSVWGNELDNRIIGNDGSDNLSGNDGNDTIDGRAGWDSIIGRRRRRRALRRRRRRGGRPVRRGGRRLAGAGGEFGLDRRRRRQRLDRWRLGRRQPVRRRRQRRHLRRGRRTDRRRPSVLRRNRPGQPRLHGRRPGVPHQRRLPRRRRRGRRARRRLRQ